eukprot:2642356-Rhodomonas_salina.1
MRQRKLSVVMLHFVDFKFPAARRAGGRNACPGYHAYFVTVNYRSTLPQILNQPTFQRKHSSPQKCSRPGGQLSL